MIRCRCSRKTSELRFRNSIPKMYSLNTELTCGVDLVYGAPVAAPGELSPHSRTSVAFERQWAIKPDILLEGGNVAEFPTGEFDTPDYLQILTTDGSGCSRSRTLPALRQPKLRESQGVYGQPTQTSSQRPCGG